MAEATYGGFWIRSLAYAADLSILTLVLLALAVPFTFMGGVGIGLFSLLAADRPDRLFRVVHCVGAPGNLRQAAVRPEGPARGIGRRHHSAAITRPRACEVRLRSGVFIGFLIVAFTGRKQGLHDVLASTVVARDGQPRIVVAILVALAGVVIPVIVIPLMFAGMFAGLMAMMMGGMLGEMEVKQTKPVPQMRRTEQRPSRARDGKAPADTGLTPAVRGRAWMIRQRSTAISTRRCSTPTWKGCASGARRPRATSSPPRRRSRGR